VDFSITSFDPGDVTSRARKLSTVNPLGPCKDFYKVKLTLLNGIEPQEPNISFDTGNLPIPT